MHSNNQPLVSCVIPFYNHNHFIKYTLDSIIEDSYPNKELIIINDGSSNKDDSNILNWIKEHKDEIEINYISRENLGLTKTLNELITIAKGKYIVLCASDDYLINNTIAHRVQLLESHPDKLLLLSDAIVVDDNNNKTHNSSLTELYTANLEMYYDDDGLKEEIIKHWSIAGATHLINKDLYDKIGLYNEDLIVEDFDFFLRAAAKNYILFDNQQVSAYRQHETNVSNDKEKEYAMKKDLYNAASTHLDLFKEPHRTMLLDKVNYYNALVKREESFSKQLKKRTKKFRYKIKDLFKRGKND